MKSISIIVAGDFCSMHPERLVMGEKLRSLLEKADLRCVNFEGPLQRGNLESANGLFLSQSNLSPKWLMNNGFNVVALANNHACDFGDWGLRASKEAFNGIYAIGCGDGWNETYDVKYIDVNGKKIGFFNATSADFSSLKDQWTDINKYGCAWINHPSVPLILQKAKQQCDYLLVLPHAGVEYMEVPLPEWRAIYRNFIDCGADAVIASHPHVPQGWEIYNGKPIYYSLGNFVFDKDHSCTDPNWYSGLIVCLCFEGDTVKVTHYCTQYDNDHIELDTRIEKIEYVNGLGKYLLDDVEYLKMVDTVVPKLANKYEQWMLSGLGAYILQPFKCSSLLHLLKYLVKNRKSDQVFLHQLREESTRWTIQRSYYLQSKIKR